MKSSLRVALLQMTSTDRVEVNVQTLLKSLQQLKTQVDIVFLPENSLYFNFNKKLNTNQILKDLTILDPLKTWVMTHKTAIHFGGVPVVSSKGICNTSLLLTDDGQIHSLYDKIHLFDVDIAGRVVRESDNFTPGSQPAIFEFKGWKIGSSICYDLRFSELFVYYHQQKVDIVLVPSSFLVETGRAHWSTLLRARAIETQAYVLAPAQGGVHRSGTETQLDTKNTWGESLVVGPWGDVLGRAPSFDDNTQGEQWLIVELSPEAIDKVRLQMPTLSHRKLKFT